MGSNSSESEEIEHQFLFFNVYKNGRVEILNPTSEKIPPISDPITGVLIKDVHISPILSARIFLPEAEVDQTDNKLPVLLYVHGGAFCMCSAFDVVYTRYVTALVAQAKVIAISVEYGLFPTRPIPACYEDSWAALQWVASHANGSGPDPWINEYADFKRGIFIAGDSAGGNICHNLAVRVGSTGLPNGVKLEGMVLIHPYFGEDDKMWMYMCPTNEGPQDRRMKAAAEDLERIGCGRVLVLVGENDGLRNAGVNYVEELKKSGWKGVVELVENKGKDHCFDVHDPTDDQAPINRLHITSFIHNQEN